MGYIIEKYPPLWEIKKMPDVVKWGSGGTPKATIPEYYDGGTIPWLIIGDLNDGVVRTSATKITQLGLDNSSAKMIPAGTLLVAMYGSIGKLGITGIPCCTNQAIAYAKKLHGVTTKYMFFFMARIKSELISKGKGGTQKNISQTVLNSLYVPVPPLSEQERIVSRIEELFSELDKAVETLQKIKRQLAVYRQAVLKEAFEGESDWRYLRAEQIGEVNLGRQRSPKNISKDYPTKYIRAANITEHGLDFSDILEMEFTPKEREKYYLKKDDIVVSEASGSPTQVGKPAIWDYIDDEFCFQNTVIRHRVQNEYPRYVYWFYKYMYISGITAKLVGGVGINHLGAKNFGDIIIPLPLREKQQSIVEQIESRLSVCDNIEKTVDAALAQSDALRQSILKEAFEGRL